MQKVLSFQFALYFGPQQFGGLHIVSWENELFTRWLASAHFIPSRSRRSAKAAGCSCGPLTGVHLRKFSTARAWLRLLLVRLMSLAEWDQCWKDAWKVSLCKLKAIFVRFLRNVQICSPRNWDLNSHWETKLVFPVALSIKKKSNRVLIRYQTIIAKELGVPFNVVVRGVIQGDRISGTCGCLNMWVSSLTPYASDSQVWCSSRFFLLVCFSSLCDFYVQLGRVPQRKDISILTEGNPITNHSILNPLHWFIPEFGCSDLFLALILELTCLFLCKSSQANETWWGREQVTGTQKWQKQTTLLGIHRRD